MTVTIDSDTKVALWWNQVKDNHYWSGAIVHFPWEVGRGPR